MLEWFQYVVDEQAKRPDIYHRTTRRGWRTPEDLSSYNPTYDYVYIFEITGSLRIRFHWISRKYTNCKTADEIEKLTNNETLLLIVIKRKKIRMADLERWLKNSNR